jgi:hypothetical protein
MSFKREKEESHQALAESHACFVLITCSEPSEDGKMQVEMTYEGDPSLAAYLIESAYGLIENQNEALISND